MIGAGPLTEGLTILFWTAFLRFITAPLYELTTREVARYAKMKMDYLEEKMFDANYEFSKDEFKFWKM